MGRKGMCFFKYENGKMWYDVVNIGKVKNGKNTKTFTNTEN